MVIPWEMTGGRVQRFLRVRAHGVLVTDRWPEAAGPTSPTRNRTGLRHDFPPQGWYVPVSGSGRPVRWRRPRPCGAFRGRRVGVGVRGLRGVRGVSGQGIWRGRGARQGPSGAARPAPARLAPLGEPRRPRGRTARGPVWGTSSGVRRLRVSRAGEQVVGAQPVPAAVRQGAPGHFPALGEPLPLEGVVERGVRRGPGRHGQPRGSLPWRRNGFLLHARVQRTRASDVAARDRSVMSRACGRPRRRGGGRAVTRFRPAGWWAGGYVAPLAHTRGSRASRRSGHQVRRGRSGASWSPALSASNQWSPAAGHRKGCTFALGSSAVSARVPSLRGRGAPTQGGRQAARLPR